MSTAIRAFQRSVGAALGLAFLAGAAHAQQSRLDEIIKRDKLIVGTFNTAPPLAFVDEKGQLTGFEVELSRLIAKYLLGDPNKIEFVTFTAEGRWPSVLSGKVDYGIASTTVYPDRAARVAFTQPYMDSGISVLLRKDANVEHAGGTEQRQVYARQPEQSADAGSPQALHAEDAEPRLRHPKRDVPRRQDRPRPGHADGYGRGGLLFGAEPRAQGAARRPRQHPEQRHLHEAGRLHLVALSRYGRAGATGRIALR